jgi:hypothetical protein
MEGLLQRAALARGGSGSSASEHRHGGLETALCNSEKGEYEIAMIQFLGSMKNWKPSLASMSSGFTT